MYVIQSILCNVHYIMHIKCKLNKCKVYTCKIIQVYKCKVLHKCKINYLSEIIIIELHNNKNKIMF